MTEQQRHRTLAGFFSKEYRTMVRYVKTLIDDAAERDGEDIVQDVMAAFISAADVTIPINNLAAYLYEALRNRVIDMLRRRKKHLSLDAPLTLDDKETATLLDVIADTKQDPVGMVEKKRQRERIMEAIDNLPDEQRAVVIATEIDDRTFSELAEAWDVPIGTLLARKSRAVEKIRCKLSALENAPHVNDNIQ
jgi:RNA polymerase sigma factor (sigma-70 family)